MNGTHSFPGCLSKLVNLFPFVILLLPDAYSLLSLHVLPNVSWQSPGDLKNLEQNEAAPLLVGQLKQTVKGAARLEQSWRGPTHDGLVRKFTSEKE